MWEQEVTMHAGSVGSLELLRIVTEDEHWSSLGFRWPLWMVVVHGHVEVVQWILARDGSGA